jgi:hypothetical protein
MGRTGRMGRLPVSGAFQAPTRRTNRLLRASSPEPILGAASEIAKSSILLLDTRHTDRAEWEKGFEALR